MAGLSGTPMPSGRSSPIGRTSSTDLRSLPRVCRPFISPGAAAVAVPLTLRAQPARRAHLGGEQQVVGAPLHAAAVVLGVVDVDRADSIGDVGRFAILEILFEVDRRLPDVAGLAAPTHLDVDETLVRAIFRLLIELNKVEQRESR